MGEETLFLLAYKFWIFNADDEIHFSVSIRRYRIFMRISYLLTFTSTELEFLNKNNSKMTDEVEYCRSCT
jgi:hypothetical protein